jgi:hypothetical protein
MRKTIAIAITLFFIAYGSYAQISGGIRLGANFSNVNIDSDFADFTYDSKIGAIAGVYIVGNISEKFAIQPELLYIGYGGRYEDFKLNLDYITVPVFIQYKITDMININAGPQFGFLLSAEEWDIDIKENLESLDLGAAFGVGLNFGKFNIGARYTLGLSDISKEKLVSIKNNALQLVLGYQLFGK